MALEEKAEEALETLWLCTEEAGKTVVTLAELDSNSKELIPKLVAEGYLARTDDSVKLTEKGKPLARSVIRRHRLAERLLADVLGTGDRLMDEKACKFEHLLDRGLDESVCILLGHPKVCPHGKPIPPGRCCLQKESASPRLVAPLSQLNVGQKGRVAYIYAPESSQLQKLVAMGILPGAPVHLIQSFPSYVFQVRQTQFAVDREIAEAIYVRLGDEDAAPEVTAKPASRRFRWWGGRKQA